MGWDDKINEQGAMVISILKYPQVTTALRADTKELFILLLYVN